MKVRVKSKEEIENINKIEDYKLSPILYSAEKVLNITREDYLCDAIKGIKNYTIPKCFVDIIEEDIEISKSITKPATELLPTFPLVEAAKVMSYGAIKHGKENWRQGRNWSERYASTLRHLFSWYDGEDVNTELISGETYYSNHIDNAIADLLILRELIRIKPELDDRPVKKEG